MCGERDCGDGSQVNISYIDKIVRAQTESYSDACAVGVGQQDLKQKFRNISNQDYGAFRAGWKVTVMLERHQHSSSWKRLNVVYVVCGVFSCVLNPVKPSVKTQV